MEVTFGLGINFGPANSPASQAAMPTISVDPAAAAVQSQGVVVNNPVRFKASYDNPKNKKLTYKWTLNGQPTGDSSDTMTYTPTSPNTYQVGLTVSEANGKNPATANPVSVYAKAPPAPLPPKVAHNLTVGPITANPASATVGVPGATNNSLAGLNANNSVGAGTPVSLSATANDTLGHPLTYTWTVNGNQAGTGNPFTYTPAQPGWYRVELRVSDNQTPPSTAIASAPVTLYARDTRPPTATACNATNATLTAGQTTNLSMTGTVAQGNTLRVRWTASEGAVTNPNQAQASFNSASVNFPANPQPQTKTITLTATVTDDNNVTASCNTTVRVSTDPQAVHYGDILFSANSARVDNAAKRVLIERVYPELTGAYQGYTLALVGHTDKGERKNLDRNRVLNSAAILTAGARSCMALEPSRVQTSTIGQTESEYKDASGLASTSGSRINRNDPRSQNRRVEIWLVPAGKPMPSVMQNPQVLTPGQLRGIGCPR
jgi:outer membrane protein OmpA-like peptidoglycan-associated protein